LEQKPREYAELATETVAPLLTKVLAAVPTGGRSDFMQPTTLTEFVGGLALLPLGASKFLVRLPDTQLQEMAPRWQRLQAQAGHGLRPLFDRILHGLYQALGREKERQEVAARLKHQPVGIALWPLEEDPDQAVVRLFTQMRTLTRRR